MTDQELERLMRTNPKEVYIALFRATIGVFVFGVLCGVVGTLLYQWMKG